MFPWFRIAWLAVVLMGAPLCTAADFESQVREIERLSTTAPWQESTARIEALAPHLDALTPGQRHRIEYVRLRNLGLAGHDTAALQGFTLLLKQDMPVERRIYIYGTAINIAANVENWPLAFTWLNEALAHLPEAPGESARLLGAASYLYTLVGESGKAVELSLRGLRQAQAGSDQQALCRALAQVALAEDHARNFHVAEGWRHRQIAACTRAGDRVFIANGKYGVGKMAASLGHYEEALDWARQALGEQEVAGFKAGSHSARLLIADCLISLGRNLDEAGALLLDALDYYRSQKAEVSVAEAENFLARLAEARGNLPEALAHLKAAMDASAAAERDARDRQLAYLQVQFDTRSKEQQIALLETERRLGEAQATANARRQWLLGLGAAGLLLTAVLLSILLRRTARDRRRYRWQSEHDSLTRLCNYQQVRKLGAAAFDRARDGGGAFTAVVIDIDLFKQVNDRYGHAAGDEALRALGGWIRKVLGGRGIAGRSGGDEFTLLLDADATAADDVLQRLRGCNRPITVFGRTFQFNISAGVCQADEHIQSLEQLIHEADQALYRAKYEGRDRVVRLHDQPVAPAAGAGLVVVGGGIQFGRHVSERCLSEIRAAQVVLCLVDPFALGMIHALRPDAINLGLHYAPGKDRRQTYREIDAAIMQEVRAGKQVCAVFYGHPGVFADVPHRVIEKARAEGFAARMEPGISAEACLYADLGIDPGRRGVQSIEATHFLHYDRQVDPLGLVLMWQVALAGDLSCTRLHAEREGLQALVDKLLRYYPPRHELILYEAAQLPIDSPRIDRLALRDLPSAQYEEYTTLVIPPLGELHVDPAVRLDACADPA